MKADDFLVLQNIGPEAAGMPEAGYLPIPRRLAQAGVKDMVRISDGRMSGTAFGRSFCTSRPNPRSAARWRRSATATKSGCPSREKRIDLLVDPAEVARRLEGFTPPPIPERGYKMLYRKTVLQAPAGCDFDFLAKEATDG